MRKSSNKPIIMDERRLNFRLQPYDDIYPYNYQYTFLILIDTSLYQCWMLHEV